MITSKQLLLKFTSTSVFLNFSIIIVDYFLVAPKFIQSCFKYVSRFCIGGKDIGDASTQAAIKPRYNTGSAAAASASIDNIDSVLLIRRHCRGNHRGPRGTPVWLGARPLLHRSRPSLNERRPLSGRQRIYIKFTPSFLAIDESAVTDRHSCHS